MWAWLGAMVALAAGALGFTVLKPDGAPPPPGGPVSAAEVRRLANSFATAYAREDATRLARLLTSDAERVTPRDRQTGRAAVVGEYKRQFQSNLTTGFALEQLQAAGGRTGRATAHYKATYQGVAASTGTMTWVVIRDRGRPRIVLIKALPN
jgi:ketosteroid isomerase-like protein